jgi:hypothetical protein
MLAPLAPLTLFALTGFAIVMALPSMLGSVSADAQVAGNQCQATTVPGRDFAVVCDPVKDPNKVYPAKCQKPFEMQVNLQNPSKVSLKYNLIYDTFVDNYQVNRHCAHFTIETYRDNEYVGTSQVIAPSATNDTSKKQIAVDANAPAGNHTYKFYAVGANYPGDCGFNKGIYSWGGHIDADVQPLQCGNNAPACSDGRDNDNDGRVDTQDPGCANGQDTDETDPQQNQPACSDGRDNDGDGRVDLHDPGCANGQDSDETDPQQNQPACSDGRDNDGDGLVDLNDPGCVNGQDTDESSQQPNPPACSDGRDNDGDWKVDMQDPGCSNANDPDETDPYQPPCSGWHCHGGGGGGWMNNGQWNGQANTTVNNQVNAAAQNNTNLWQQQQNNFPFNTSQNANVNPTAYTGVNNQVNAGSWNNGAFWTGW